MLLVLYQVTRATAMQSHIQDLFQGANYGLMEAVITKLNQENPTSLTELEKDISVLLWLNFDHYEISQLLNVEVADVEMERERIRVKLALASDQSIQSFIQTNLA